MESTELESLHSRARERERESCAVRFAFGLLTRDNGESNFLLIKRDHGLSRLAVERLWFVDEINRIWILVHFFSARFLYFN